MHMYQQVVYTYIIKLDMVMIQENLFDKYVAHICLRRIGLVSSNLYIFEDLNAHGLGCVWLVRYVLEVRLGHGRSRVVAPVVVHPHLLQNPLADHHHGRLVVFLQRLHGFLRRLLPMHACTITR